MTSSFAPSGDLSTSYQIAAGALVLLSLILLDAFVAYWLMGPYWGAGISLLILPALWLGARFRTT